MGRVRSDEFGRSVGVYSQIFLPEENLQRRVCPTCGRDDAYRLGDGRLKCKKCRTKYTPHEKKRQIEAGKSMQHFRAVLAHDAHGAGRLYP